MHKQNALPISMQELPAVIRNLTNSNERLFFTANDGESGRELWTIDEQAPTQPCDPDSEEIVMVINPVAVISLDGGGQTIWSVRACQKYRRRLPKLRSNRTLQFSRRVVFSANNGKTGFEPGSAVEQQNPQTYSDINSGSSSSSPSSFTGHKKTLFFAADDGRKIGTLDLQWG